MASPTEGHFLPTLEVGIQDEGGIGLVFFWGLGEFAPCLSLVSDSLMVLVDIPTVFFHGFPEHVSLSPNVYVLEGHYSHSLGAHTT
jgi:hypothetical protein